MPDNMPTRNPAIKIRKLLTETGTSAILLRGASSSFIVNIVGTAIAFGINILLARLMGIEQYGIYIYALAWINVMALISQLGMNTSLLRFVSAYRAKGQWGLMRGLLAKSFVYVLATSIVTGSVACITVFFLHDQISTHQEETFLIALLLLPLLSLTGLRSAALRALRHVVKAEIPDSIIRPLLIALLGTGFYTIFQQPIYAMQVMTFNLFAALVAFVIGTIWLINALPEQVRSASPAYSHHEWVKVSLPLFFVAGMNMVLHQTDTIMVGAFLNTDSAGIYATASRIAGLTFFGLTAVNAIVAPLISELHSTERHDELQKMLSLAARWILIVTMVLSAALIAIGHAILGLFGEAFVAGYPTLVILICAQIVNAMAGSVGFLMTMTGHQIQAAKILGACALLNILLNFIFISRLGPVGAALATAITTAMWNLIMLVYVWKKLNLNPTVFAGKAS